MLRPADSRVLAARWLLPVTVTTGRGLQSAIRSGSPEWTVKGRMSPFLFLKEKLFELYGIFTVAFIKILTNIGTLLNVKVFLCKKEAVYFQYTCNNHGNFHAFLYQTIRIVWRFCYIKQCVGFCLCYDLCR